MTSSTYRFNGNTIKLKDKDFDRWQKAFKNIPNLEAVLQSRDDWLTYDAEIKTQQRWFLSTSAYLAKLDAKEAKENRTDSVGRKVDAEGRVKFKTEP